MSNSLATYYTTICKEPFLSREEEYELACTYKNPESSPEEKEAAKHKLINSNLRFVFKKAKQASGNDPVMFAELICAGNEGLLVGLEKYVPSMDVKFLSYAGWWVFQRMQNEMSDMRLVSLPTWKQQLSAKIQKLKEALGDEKLTLEKLKEAFPEIPEKDLGKNLKLVWV
jgi:RNA polymerase primary sigma factor